MDIVGITHNDLDAEIKRSDIDGEEHVCWMILFIADKDFKDEN